jgi:hypothetical protein
MLVASMYVCIWQKLHDRIEVKTPGDGFWSHHSPLATRHSLLTNSWFLPYVHTSSRHAVIHHSYLTRDRLTRPIEESWGGATAAAAAAKVPPHNSTLTMYHVTAFSPLTYWVIPLVKVLTVSSDITLVSAAAAAVSDVVSCQLSVVTITSQAALLLALQSTVPCPKFCFVFTIPELKDHNKRSCKRKYVNSMSPLHSPNVVPPSCRRFYRNFTSTHKLYMLSPVTQHAMFYVRSGSQCLPVYSNVYLSCKRSCSSPARLMDIWMLFNREFPHHMDWSSVTTIGKSACTTHLGHVERNQTTSNITTVQYHNIPMLAYNCKSRIAKANVYTADRSTLQDNDYGSLRWYVICQHNYWCSFPYIRSASKASLIPLIRRDVQLCMVIHKRRIASISPDRTYAKAVQNQLECMKAISVIVFWLHDMQMDAMEERLAKLLRDKLRPPVSRPFWRMMTSPFPFFLLYWR